MTYLISYLNHEAVYRTAPATPGLIKTVKKKHPTSTVLSERRAPQK